MDHEPGIDVDTLAVGLTRPSTLLGVPYGAMVLNILVAVEALSLTENLLWMLMCIPVHGICYLIALKDPRAFELLALWARTTLGILLATRGYWHGSSYSPLTFRQHHGPIRRWLVRRQLKREPVA